MFSLVSLVCVCLLTLHRVCCCSSIQAADISEVLLYSDITLALKQYHSLHLSLQITGYMTDITVA